MWALLPIVMLHYLPFGYLTVLVSDLRWKLISKEQEKSCFSSCSNVKRKIQYVQYVSHLGWVHLVPSRCDTPRSVRKERTWPGCRSRCISSTPCRWTAFCPPPLREKKGREKKFAQCVVKKDVTAACDQCLISTSSPDTHNRKFSLGSLWSFLSLTRAHSFAHNLCVLPSNPPGKILFTSLEAVIMMWCAFLLKIKWMCWVISFLFLPFLVHHKDRKLFSANAPKWRGKGALGV